MNTAREFLQLLTEQRPLPKGHHHALILRDDDPTGLDLVFWTENEWRLVHLDQDDLKKARQLAGPVLVPGRGIQQYNKRLPYNGSTLPDLPGLHALVSEVLKLIDEGT